MKIYITHTFKGTENKPEIENLCRIVRESGAVDFSFIRDVENYQKIFTDPHDIMSQAKKAITDCDALLFDTTDLSPGKAIEAGIAYQLNKKIIVIFKKGSEKWNTVLGIANLVIEYDQIEDIKTPLVNYLLSIQTK
jgi:nucleoside 2-deoxyribosyltransferase